MMPQGTSDLTCIAFTAGAAVLAVLQWLQDLRCEQYLGLYQVQLKLSALLAKYGAVAYWATRDMLHTSPTQQASSHVFNARRMSVSSSVR